MTDARSGDVSPWAAHRICLGERNEVNGDATGATTTPRRRRGRVVWLVVLVSAVAVAVWLWPLLGS